ncbi:ABC transporter ATP-binding protein [Insolitispirillum peregrinum]|uniref:Spermidine/putrescine import ATP-binding protein PotA n=1 Tax=Insolitispirillum peregrinum TaxID=80876 RepID=A0A1N7K864_9PROT|nr:polyamine ABC transporter ATP-binding protein [Insolitispirillum peregrinum]SIS57738.1 putrescine transport system ATP-binding protein [Insolitispirillum peregrinum]
MSQFARNLQDQVARAEKGGSIPTDTPRSIIQIQNVTRKFGDFVAVNDVSLTIYEGELFSLLGGSGCGKTTLLRMLAGFETPSSGRILIDGQDMTHIPPFERPVNMMFQSYALFPHMTVEQNVAFGLKQDGMPSAEVKKRVAEMLDIVELSALGKRKPHQLSGGQRQRVALVRALAKRPKVLLLDEPLGALDKKLRERTQLELVNIQESLGVTFVVVTHDQEEAMTMSCRVAIMNQGRILQVDTPHAMYEYPNTRFVAEFFGSVNMFEGILVEDEADHVVIDCPELSRPIYVSHGVSGREGGTAYAAIRPEKVALSKEEPADTSRNCSTGVVQDIVYLGGESTYLVKLDSGRVVRVSLQNAYRAAEPEITWDDRVWISWQPSNVVVVSS